MIGQRHPERPAASGIVMPATQQNHLTAELVKKAATVEHLKTVLELVATALGQARCQDAAMACVTDLARRLGCDRVSFGVVRRDRVQVRALSHSARVSAKTNLLGAIAAAMEEAVDQRQTLVLPPLPSDPARVTRAHEALTRQYGAGALCSLPLLEHGQVTGMLTLERGADQPFDRSLVELCEAVGAVVGPVLEGKRRDDRWVGEKAWEALRAQAANLVGPGHVGLKLAGLALLAGLGFLMFATGDYRVTAKTVLEGQVQRAAVAPFAGYLDSAPARAGDVVQTGQVLAKLQDHELKLERLKWLSQQEQLAKEYRQAMAERDAAKVEIKSAELAQAEAQLALATDKLSRIQITAPFAGVVVTGDWSQQLGSPVEEGTVLFEIAPLDAYRVVVQVDERDITALQVGQPGTVLLASLPQEPLPVTVRTITPVSTAKEGRNFFRLEAAFTTPPSARLRPAMEGVAKIEIDRRRLIWIWTHETLDWLRLTLWAWLP